MSHIGGSLMVATLATIANASSGFISSAEGKLTAAPLFEQLPSPPGTLSGEIGTTATSSYGRGSVEVDAVLVHGLIHAAHPDASHRRAFRVVQSGTHEGSRA